MPAAKSKKKKTTARSKTKTRGQKGTTAKKKTVAKKSSKKKTSAKKKTGKKTTSSRAPSAKKKDLYDVGEYVVYPMHGVGQISAISKQVILGKRKECYVLEITSNKMKVMIPTESAQEIGIRSIIKKRDVKKVLDLLQKDEVDPEEDWKIRYQNNMNKIKSGDIYSVAEVCRNLYKRARDKELSLMERRLYESAYNLISNEIALTRGVTVEEASNMISEVLS
ncbi:MAG: transcriptional regulator [Leptospiraceae bacterium]|nr:transcriptional regulator [Leptospiraceae bacterium]